MNFLFNVNFWGERYTRFFLDYSLPSQLAAGNIPYMLDQSQVTIKYLIYTTREDAGLVVSSPAYAKLCEMVETEIIDFEEFDLYNRHNRGTMTQCHAHAIQYANTNNYSLLFIWPDTIYSCNSFGTLCNLALSGKTSAFVGSLAVHTGRFLDDLTSNYVVVDGALTLPPRELVAIGARNLSMQSEQWMWSSPYFQNRPSWIYWYVPGEGLLQRAFHLTPIMLTPDDRTLPLTYNPLDELGLDGNHYLSNAINALSSMHVIEDSDDFLAVSLNDVVLSKIHSRFNAIEVVLYAREVFLPYHFSLFTHKLRFHQHELSAKWEMLEDVSEKVAQEIFALLKLVESYPYYFTMAPSAPPKLIGNIDDFNVVAFEGKYFALAQSLGPVDLATISEAELMQLQQEKSCFDGLSLEQIKVDILDAYDYLNHARIFIEQNDLQSAYKCISKILAIDPQNNDAIQLAKDIISERDKLL